MKVTLARPWSLARKLTVAYVATALLGVATTAILVHYLFVLAGHIDRLIALGVPFDANGANEHRGAMLDVRSAMLWTALSLAGYAVWTGSLALLLVRMVKALRRRHADLRDYVERIERSNRDLDAFAGRVAHDIRNLLGPLAAVGPLLRKALEAGPAHPAAATIYRAADRIERRLNASARLIDALLAFSRGSEPDGAARTESTSSILEEVLDELEPLRERMDATVDRYIEDMAVQCAPGLMHVLVMNLVSNAIKFLEGQPLRRVRVACMRLEGRPCIEVQDSGPGIPPEHIDRVFEPFYRAPNVAGTGFGIGLATVRRIVEAHDAEMHVRSEVGVGTTIRVTFPPVDRPSPRPTISMGSRAPELRL